jgi:plasmid stability protein
MIGMSAIHVRHVPKEVIAALKERAARNGRSMQQELLSILKAAATAVPAARDEGPLPLVKVRTGGESTWSREDEYGDEGR